MADPTIEEVRRAKDKLREALRGHTELAGIGIGKKDGKLCVQVNWRKLPPAADQTERIGDVDVAHTEVGSIQPLKE